LTLIELRLWTGVTPFQWLLHAIALLLATIFLTLKLTLLPRITFFGVFAPFFVALFLDGYFIFVVIARGMVTDKDQTRIPGLMTIFGSGRVVMMGFFEYFLLAKIDGEYEHNQIQSGYTWTIVFLPIWILLCGLGIQACRMVVVEDAVLELLCCFKAEPIDTTQYAESLRRVMIHDPIFADPDSEANEVAE
ncbi:hypothetical protein PFISCL1PPCAC_16574, partial [Pristionchus fissidentatus]